MVDAQDAMLAIDAAEKIYEIAKKESKRYSPQFRAAVGLGTLLYARSFPYTIMFVRAFQVRCARLPFGALRRKREAACLHARATWIIMHGYMTPMCIAHAHLRTTRAGHRSTARQRGHEKAQRAICASAPGVHGSASSYGPGPSDCRGIPHKNEATKKGTRRQVWAMAK